MTIEEAIEYWEELRKTFSCQIEKEENHFGRMHLQTTIDVIDTTLSAIRAQKEYTSPCDLCRYNPPSSFDGKPCALCPAAPKEPTEEEQYRMTNADRIRAMSDEELEDFLIRIEGEQPWSTQFSEKFCDNCPTTTCTVEGYGHPIELSECDFIDGKCPHGIDIVWWLQQPAEEEKHGV